MFIESQSWKVKTLNITEKRKLISINAVTDADDLMIINKSGLTIRMAIEDLRVMGRNTRCETNQLERKDSIAAVTKVMKDDVAEVIVMKMETSLKQKQ
jgi:DNA gyrase subunit A